MGEPTSDLPVENGSCSKRIKEEPDSVTEGAPDAKKARLDSTPEESVNGSSIKKENGAEIKTETKEVLQTAEERGEPDLEFLIVRQVEYYFGDFNLPKDKFLQEQIKLDDGWIPLDVMLKFRRLADLSKNTSTIVTCLKSSSTLLEVSEDGTKIRRLPSRPLPTMNDEWQKSVNERTAYCKGFPQTITDIDSYIQFFRPYGPVENISLRWYVDKATKERKFKGSLYVLFETKELVEKFLALEKLCYENAELVRMTHAAHVEEKNKEKLERWGKKVKKDPKETAVEEKAKGKKDFAKGCILKVCGINDEELTREVIKTTLVNLGAEVAFIQFSKGEKEALVRLNSQEEGAATQFIQKLEGGKVKFGEEEVEVSCLEGQEEEEFLQKTREQMERTHKTFRNKRGGNQRGGHRGGYKGHHKRGRSPMKKEASN